MERDFIKVTNAVYRVLDFLPDGDPLKNKAKEKTLAIMENLTLIFGAQGWVSLGKEMASAQLLDDIDILENYLRIGRDQGWVDTMNFLIITKEYGIIKSNINPPKGLIRQSLEIARLGEPRREPRRPTSADVGRLERGKDTERQVKILDVLNKKGKAQVSDFIKELPNVTKRTVRRDLDDLLKKGKIMRVGEWNQVFYHLKDRTYNLS